jgi:chromatin remodeling complex protein RSC6
MGVEEASRGDVVKKIWEYIKENKLQKPEDKRTIVLDDKLYAIFERKTVTMFSMNKFLSKHIKRPELM